ncbi:2-(1,2-epoxy-1,2-dihydrophenyl)acetyl-CoA isomerase [Afipia massiliensis]|uniref:2-(1,2-epoxy-1,2-dihydrophenyl)acetyl-CoA isomerase n=1 Tax=Afipia massiliensis TaxID=211460 RepID=A0A840MXR3_9BRAD|nr:2-(1,2-epoxy-1,2-dihydrophenyl)acetyl-CoA isomerase [Afipia massiliensis]
MTDEQPVLLKVDGPITRIVFNRPKVLNALNVAAAEAFLAACKSVAADSGNRVVIIAGEGRAFMAGGDVSTFQGPAEEVRKRVPTIMEPLHEGLEILAGLPQPVIASLHGPVAGAGMSIALSTDLAIAADTAIFTLAYSKLGTSPDGSSSWSLPRLVGLRKAMEIALLSDVYDAPEALRLGLVNRVVPAADLASETEKLARRLADGPTFALGKAKALLRGSLDNSMHDQMEAEAVAFGACIGTADFAEGVGAFLAKRQPTFKGK